MTHAVAPQTPIGKDGSECGEGARTRIATSINSLPSVTRPRSATYIHFFSFEKKLLHPRITMCGCATTACVAILTTLCSMLLLAVGVPHTLLGLVLGAVFAVSRDPAPRTPKWPSARQPLEAPPEEEEEPMLELSELEDASVAGCKQTFPIDDLWLRSFKMHRSPSAASVTGGHANR